MAYGFWFMARFTQGMRAALFVERAISHLPVAIVEKIVNQ
jgi:hypothetical protein